jgi:hypothetical protein
VTWTRPINGQGVGLMNRNEAMDATHLAEFFQVEGVVADYDITLGNLVGMSYPIPLHISLFEFGRRCITDNQHSWRSSLQRWEIRN